MTETGETLAASTSLRDQKIDALRGLAIFLVVLGHAAFVPFAQAVQAPGLVPLGGAWVERSVAFGAVFNIVYSFHMPLFAFLSSFVLYGREGGSDWALLRRRFLQLMLPYIVWVVVGVFVHGVPLADAPRVVLTTLLYPLTGGAPWFLYALFGCFVIFVLVRLIHRSDAALIVSAVVIALVSVIPMTRFGDLFGAYDIALIYPFFIMGYLVAKHRGRFAELKWPVFAASLVVWPLTLTALWPVMVPELNGWYVPLTQALHAHGLRGAFILLAMARYGCGAAGVFVAYYLYDWVGGWFMRAQAFLGVRTLGIYVSHRFFLEFAAGYTHSILLLTVIGLAGGVVVTLVLERWMWTSFVFLGKVPRKKPAPSPLPSG